MSVIYKYEIKAVNQWVYIDLPLTAKILSFQHQPGSIIVDSGLMFWAIVKGDSQESFTRKFIAVGTGIDFSQLEFNGAEMYIGTAQVDSLVWHLFEQPHPASVAQRSKAFSDHCCYMMWKQKQKQLTADDLEIFWNAARKYEREECALALESGLPITTKVEAAKIIRDRN